MEKKENYTNITSLFQRLGSKESEAGTEERTLPFSPSNQPTFSLRNSTTPSIPGIGTASHQRAPENPAKIDTPPTLISPVGSAPHSEAGTFPSGRPSYSLLKMFAQGGCGEVWEGSQVVFPRLVALKKIRPELLAGYASDEDMKQQVYRSFLQEALTTAVLEHPNIVPVYDFHLDNTGEPMLCMRLIKGRRWDQMIYEDRDMARAEYLERHLPILVQVSQAVAYAHSKGVIHRDLKPSQVMIGEFGEVYLMDWGLALVVDEDLFFRDFPDLRHASVAPTRGSNPPLGGTPAYMAPEQAEMDAWRLTFQTDIFLLGSTFFYMLTGMAPRRSTQEELDASGLLALPIEAPHFVRPEWDIPEGLGAICMKALERSPDRRHRSAREFVDELQGWLTGAYKRRESEELTWAANHRFAATCDDYSSLLECQTNLERALGLWPQNREAAHLLQAVTKAFAEVALAKEDLNLARVMADRIRAADDREEILNEITATERLSILASAEAEEAEFHIRELQASGDQISRQLADLESQREALREVTNGLVAAMSKIVAQMDSKDPDLISGLADSLMAFDPVILRNNRWAASLFSQAAKLALRAGLEKSGAILRERAKDLS